MREDKKRARALEKFMALAKARGQGIVTPELLKSEIETGEEISASMEAVLAYQAREGVGFKRKACTFCTSVFATDYNHVGYCSDRCRIKALREIGIDFDPTRQYSERWRQFGGIPLVIPPAALLLLDQLNSTDDTPTDEVSDIPSVEPALID